MKLVSIIMPVFNIEKFVGRSIESALYQTHTNWELIIVDDGSSDSSPAICDRYAQQDARIKVIHKSNGGPSSARNIGLDIMNGEYVTFLDGDDYWHCDYLHILYELSQKHDAGIVQCNFIMGVASSFPPINLLKHEHIYDNHSIFLERVSKIILWAKLYRSELWVGVRMPIGKLNEDDFTTWKLYYQSSITVVTPLKLYYYYQGNTNSIMKCMRRTPKFDYLEAYSERISYFERAEIRDLTDDSIRHFCLVLLLNYRNDNLSVEQRDMILQIFRKNHKKIRHSRYVPFSYQILFSTFNRFPKLVSNLIK